MYKSQVAPVGRAELYSAQALDSQMDLPRTYFCTILVLNLPCNLHNLFLFGLRGKDDISLWDLNPPSEVFSVRWRTSEQGFQPSRATASHLYCAKCTW